ncbi:hypothetical protein DmAi_19370 [Acetobacter persici]|uniref:Uncharacterized protein n=1 Tax=Acetobacter persici TaxID=1076596 RepID=A0A6V8I8B6_9PROT|nr:hypothetical protein DmAi_19370 [Acetobacter persici]
MPQPFLGETGRVEPGEGATKGYSIPRPVCRHGPLPDMSMDSTQYPVQDRNG